MLATRASRLASRSPAGAGHLLSWALNLQPSKKPQCSLLSSLRSPFAILQAGSTSATGSGSPTAAKRKAAGSATAASAGQGQLSGGQAGHAGGPGSPSKGGSAPDGLPAAQQQAAPAAGSADLMSLDTPDPQALQAVQVRVLLGDLAGLRVCDISAQVSQAAG